ncbi:uncharacterized protein LOC142597871 [Dermatophagoides farinae]|uniref:uncharacterized protein LOC142597871 n=1 Tax=Dermatophagoides farinae TaxID=6954 RepID=UPI003F5FA556
MVANVKVALYVFDCIAVDDLVLLDQPLEERLNLDNIEKFLQEAIDSNTEGLMIKLLNGPLSYYEPNKRNTNWLKVKKDYIETIGDSIDLAIVGAYYGKGRRTNVYGSFLMSVYDEEDDNYRTVCKIATGFDDNQLTELHKQLETSIIKHKPQSVVSNLVPDVWFDPSVVLEVRAADLFVSPVHTACNEMGISGIGLRFPRLVKIRDDKNVKQIASSSQIFNIYKSQVSISNSDIVLLNSDTEIDE